MKATELMIGDWAEFHQSDGQGFYAQVEALNNDGTFSESGFYADNDVSPIPLTAEILEKNGWIWDGMYACFDYNGNKEFMWYKHEGICRDFYIHKNGEKELIFLTRPGIIFVHQLQHALRMCRIEKEITL